jgi:hypothetical protein
MRILILCLILSSASLVLESIPGDSLVGALLSWKHGGAPRRDLVRDLGMEIVHEFVLQPLILVYGSGDQLRALARSDSTVTIRVTGGMQAYALEACGR